MGDSQCQGGFRTGFDRNPLVGLGGGFGKPRIHLNHFAPGLFELAVCPKHAYRGSPPFDDAASETQYQGGVFNIKPGRGLNPLHQVQGQFIGIPNRRGADKIRGAVNGQETAEKIRHGSAIRTGYGGNGVGFTRFS